MEELNLKTCGCGGEAIVSRGKNFVRIYCHNCGIKTYPHESEEVAVMDWNRAMSVPECAAPWDPDRNRYCCERCGHYVGKYDAYCGGCGAKLTDYTPDGRGKQK